MRKVNDSDTAMSYKSVNINDGMNSAFTRIRSECHGNHHEKDSIVGKEVGHFSRELVHHELTTTIRIHYK